MKGIIANLFTGSRIVFSLIMLFFPTFSFWFYFCYVMGGVTDMVDGTIARKLGTESEFGEKLDTVADFLFVASALYKLLPEVRIDAVIWIWIGVIALIKIINIISGFVTQKRFVTIHSWANKITGFVLFLFPFSFHTIDIRYSSAAICLLATFAAIWEGHLLISKAS